MISIPVSTASAVNSPANVIRLASSRSPKLRENGDYILDN